ncbi:hypothetical protein VTL71DRAFT_1178 [Oculimacula yallundae]|uniref:Uncharacterized protein n=1 Tax=Oculimacula yallundae TaxID=86028 RepID=A0ABR4D2B5_9HELO
MKDCSTRTVEIRIQQLRDGGDRNKSMWKAGAIAFVPLVKYWGWFCDSNVTFNRVAIDALGLSDFASIKELYRWAKAVADRSTLFQPLQPVGGVSGRGIGQQAAMDLMAELVHLKPVNGQILSGTRAAAINIHLRRFAVTALAETFPQEFGVGKWREGVIS